MTEHVLKAALLPCPFCGVGGAFMDAQWAVCCNNIDCQASTTAFATADEAIAAWNRRVVPFELSAAIASCRTIDDLRTLQITIKHIEEAEEIAHGS